MTSRLRQAIIKNINSAFMRQEGVPFDIEEVPGATESIDAIIDSVVESLPTKLQLPEEARTAIRGGWYKEGWNDSLDDIKSILLEAKENNG